MTGRDDAAASNVLFRVDGLVRERLVRSLDAALDVGLGTVVAPHGAGKTTLLAHWAAHSPVPTVRHRVQASDAQPDRLFARLGREAATVLGGPEARSAAALAAVLAESGDHVCLVLDDVHTIVGTPAESELERLLVLGVPTAHVLLAGRREPSFNLIRPEFSSSVLVDEDALRFRPHEAHALFRDVYGQELDPFEVLDLVRATDGWAAGLHLFHVHSRHRGPVERARATSGPGLRYTRNYLVHHVVGGLTAQETETMRVASLFDVVTPGRCDELLGRSGTTAPVLEALSQRALLTRADDGWRMPEAVRQYFAADLRECTTPGRAAVQRRRAADLLAAEGDLPHALTLLACDGRWTEIREMLLRAGPSAIRPGGCEWAAPPPGLTDGEGALAVAEARRLLDDGLPAEAHSAACRALTGTVGVDWAGAAAELRDRSAVWRSPGSGGATAPPDALRDAVRRHPEDVARALGAAPRPEDLLPAGVARLLAGDVSGALRLLRRSAQGISQDPPQALAAQLVLAVAEARWTAPAPEPALMELDAVHRHARRDGLTWLARLSEGVLSALSGDDAGRELCEAVVRDCEERGDHWGASLLRTVTALTGAGGDASADAYADLAARFRALGADVLAGWALSLVARWGGPGLEITGPRRPPEPGGARAAGSGWPGGPSLSVRCFGGLSVSVGTVPLDLSGVRPRARTVLSLLALHAGRPVHRDRLSSVLWDDLDEARSLHNLQVSISSLRRALHAQGAGDGRQVVVRQGNSYALAPGAWSDLAEFDRLLRDAATERRRGDRGRAEAALQGALDLYVDDVLPEEGPAEWVLEVRERYRLGAAQAAGDLARTRASLGRRDTAIDAAERSVELDPWRDESWRLLVELLQDAGELAEAERTRRRYRAMLHSLGIGSGAV